VRGYQTVGVLSVAAAVGGLGLVSDAIGGPAHVATTCGVERWAVKTLQDARASRVSFSSRASTVDRLRRLTAPDIGRSTPRQPGERVTYRLRAAFRAAKLEDDSDIHLVIASPATGRTMIAEFPDPAAPTASGAESETSCRREAYSRRDLPSVHLYIR
jgi:hypothetical protein